MIGNCDRLTFTYFGEEDLSPSEITFQSWRDTLPSALLIHLGHLILILKYHRHFFTWNDDLSSNMNNLKILSDESKDGLPSSKGIMCPI